MASPKYDKGTFIVVANAQHLEWIHPSAQVIYMRLCKYANDCGKCFPSVHKISKVSWISKPTVLKYIDHLCAYWLVTKEQRFEDWSQTTNLYSLPLLEGVKDFNPPVKTFNRGSKKNWPPPVKTFNTELNQSELSDISTNVDISEAEASWRSDLEEKTWDDFTTSPSPSSGDPLPDPQFPRDMRKRTSDQIKKLDELLDELEKYSEELGVVWDDKEERIYGRHLLTAKAFSELSQKLWKTNLEAAKFIMQCSVELPYLKWWVANSAKQIYLRRADILTARKKANKQDTSDNYSERERTFRSAHCGPEVQERIYSLPEIERRALATELNRKHKQFRNNRDDERFRIDRLESMHKHLQQQTAA